MTTPIEEAVAAAFTTEAAFGYALDEHQKPSLARAAINALAAQGDVGDEFWDQAVDGRLRVDTVRAAFAQAQAVNLARIAELTERLGEASADSV